MESSKYLIMWPNRKSKHLHPVFCMRSKNIIHEPITHTETEAVA